MAIVVYVPVDLGIAVEGDLLGTTWPVPGTPAPCVFHLPRRMVGPIDAAGWGHPLRGPDLSGAEDAIEQRQRGWRTDEELAGFRMWGGVYHWNRDEDCVLRAHVERAVAVTHYDGDDDADARLAFAAATNEAVDAWVRGLIDWLEVISRYVIGEPGASDAPTPPAEWETMTIASSGRAVWFVKPPGVIHRTVWEQGAVSLDHWQQAARHANARTPLPLAHGLLRDARHARRRDDGRRAVIDAATACEVALSASIRARLATMPSPALDDLVDRRLRGVMALFDFHHRGLARITTVTQKGLQDGLAEARNKVAHAGYRPENPEVTAAINVAEMLLAEVAPLPAPGDG